MVGNVREWTDIWYDKEEENRVLRGGSWYNFRSFARCAFRFWAAPVPGFSLTGFRCARTLK
jgi:formylglycine-generating enzyme required for sulfatase activity